MFRGENGRGPFTSSVDDLSYFFAADIASSHDSWNCGPGFIVCGDKAAMFCLQELQGQYLIIRNHANEDKDTVNGQGCFFAGRIFEVNLFNPFFSLNSLLMVLILAVSQPE